MMQKKSSLIMAQEALESDNKNNSGWCIRVRKMNRSINNCLRSKVSDMTSSLVLMEKVE